MKIRFYQWLAHKLSKKFLYYCVIEAWAKASTDTYSDKHPDEITWVMVCKYLERWGLEYEN